MAGEGAMNRTIEAELADFEGVYRRNLAFVWRTLRHHGIPNAQLEDTAHEVFIVLYRKFRDYKGPAALTTLLYGIARRVAANQRRSVARSDRRRQVAPAPVAVGDPEDLVRRRQAADLVGQFLSSLRPDSAEAFRLSQVDGMTAKQIAEVSGENLNTINTRIRVAKQRFVEFVAKLDGCEGSKS